MKSDTTEQTWRMLFFFFLTDLPSENFSFPQSEHSDSIRAATPAVNESVAASEQRNDDHDLSPPSRKQPNFSNLGGRGRGSSSSIGGADSLTRRASTNTQHHPPSTHHSTQPNHPPACLPSILPRMTDEARPETSTFIGPHYPPAADPDGPDFYPTVLDLVISFF